MQPLTILPAPEAFRTAKVVILEAEERESEASGRSFTRIKCRLIGTRHFVYGFISHAPQAAWVQKAFAEAVLKKKELEEVRRNGIGSDTLGRLAVDRQCYVQLRYETHADHGGWQVRQWRHLKEGPTDASTR